MKGTAVFVLLLLAACQEPPMAREGSESLWQGDPPPPGTQPPPDPCANLGIDALLVSPRLLSPLSTSRATSRRPTFKWSSCADARVQICGDRSCSVVLSNNDVAGESWTPAADLAGNNNGNGNVYYWRVAARVGSQLGAWSKVWQVNVPSSSAPFASSGGSVLDADLDGWPEFGVGAREADAGRATDAGVLYLYEGGRRSSTSPLLTLSQPTPQTGADFGMDHGSAGDVNGDGFADLLVGAHRAKTGAVVTGAAYLFFGGPSGLGTSPTVLSGPLDDSAFGYSVSGAGDVDGDGYADFLVGAPKGGASDRGEVYLYLGKPGTLHFQPSAVLTGSGIDGAGMYMAGVGDLDGDGYSDIALGEGQILGTFGATSARVFLWYGGPSGISGPGLEIIEIPAPTGLAYAYGVSEATDLDGDGYHDLVVGLTDSDGIQGAIYVWYGGPDGIDPDAPSILPDSPTSTPFLGGTLSGTGDLDGDGVDDLLFRQEVGSTNQVLVQRSTVGALEPIADPDPSGAGPFGESLRIVGDVDGNGLADFLVGKPSPSSGVAYLYLSDGAAPTPSDALALTPTGSDAGWVGF